VCGLVGILTSRSGNLDTASATLRKMTQNLIHRGPDAEGIWAEGIMALGHRRLSVQDLSEAGAQPMMLQDSQYVIVFNGEIYNHLDLRRYIEEQGVVSSWRGHSDTETLLTCIVHWGLDETLRRASGMFALALWDRHKERLFLARDRMGEKPLYWGWAGKDLVFGSELKALRHHSGFPRAVCRDSFLQYLNYAYVPAPRSIHPGIYKLEPGCIVQVDGPLDSSCPREPLRPGARHGSVSIRRYWSLNDVLEIGNKSQIASEADAVEEVKHVMSQAVARQMNSDVPLGAFLSGGIDSSLIVALMTKQSNHPVHTYTIGFENASFDESPYAATVAQHLGTEHTEMTVTDRDARDVIPLLSDLYDEPFADSSQIPTFLVCRAAREHVTVALSGDGGDELFGGYNRYILGPSLWRKLEKFPKPIRRGLGIFLSSTPMPTWRALDQRGVSKKKLNHVGDKVQKIARALRDADNIDDLYLSLISSGTGSSWSSVSSNTKSAILSDTLPEYLATDPAARMMAQDMRSYLPDDILCKVDRAAMAVSLETRAPFLDPEVINLAARLPISMKIRGSQGKWILRQILYEHVPRKLIERPKMGFSIPLGEWLRGPLKSWAENLLSPQALEIDDLIDPKPVRLAWKQHLSGRGDWTRMLWVILVFQAWRVRWL
jgi:asparagine synthase (glutamine-hydrolysing)